MGETDLGDPLTAEEQAEKEQLLEEVSSLGNTYAYRAYLCYIIFLFRAFQLGQGKTSMLSLEHVRSMDGMILRV